MWPRVGGCIAGLYVDVNSEPIPMESLVERPRAMAFVGGGESPSWASGIALFYAPDFDAVEQSSYKPIGFRACDYVLRLDGLLHRGRNSITFQNNLHFSWAAQEIPIALADVALVWRAPSQFSPPKVWQPTPAGPLNVFQPRRTIGPTTRRTAAGRRRGGCLEGSAPERRVAFQSSGRAVGRGDCGQGKWMERCRRRRGALPCATPARCVWNGLWRSTPSCSSSAIRSPTPCPETFCL